MKQLYQQLGLKKPIPGILGIEIEAEGEDMNAVGTNYWKSENDGSLRGHYPESRAEFVLNQPIMLEEVLPALHELIAALPNAKFDFSYRTSVHVHVNVQKFTHTQILNMVYTYMLLEEPLMTYCGKSRKANRFCLRLGDAEGLMDTIQYMIKNGEGSHKVCGDDVRYSAINLAALNKYGSIEFRGMRGNIDVNVIHTWTRALAAIREFALAQEDPKKIRELVEKQGAAQFMKLVLGDELSKVFTYPKLLKDMSKSYSISLDIPYSFERYKHVPPEKVKKQKIVFIKGHDNDEINRYRKIEGQEIVYMGNHYRSKDGDYVPLGRYKGPPEEELAQGEW